MRRAGGGRRKSWRPTSSARSPAARRHPSRGSSRRCRPTVETFSRARRPMTADGRIQKRFPVFDCDAHINEPDGIRGEYVEPGHRDLVRGAYWDVAPETSRNARAGVSAVAVAEI